MTTPKPFHQMTIPEIAEMQRRERAGLPPQQVEAAQKEVQRLADWVGRITYEVRSTIAQAQAKRSIKPTDSKTIIVHEHETTE